VREEGRKEKIIKREERGRVCCRWDGRQETGWGRDR
jgi:ribosomal protein L36